jgi:hypothetical protein
MVRDVSGARQGAKETWESNDAVAHRRGVAVAVQHCHSGTLVRKMELQRLRKLLWGRGVLLDLRTTTGKQ